MATHSSRRRFPERSRSRVNPLKAVAYWVIPTQIILPPAPFEQAFNNGSLVGVLRTPAAGHVSAPGLYVLPTALDDAGVYCGLLSSQLGVPCSV